MSNGIVLEKRDGFWRASLKGADHIGGTGETPEEAIGRMCLSNPQRMGIGEFRWKHRPPKLPHPEVEQYPEGVQEPFGTEPTE